MHVLPESGEKARQSVASKRTTLRRKKQWSDVEALWSPPANIFDDWRWCIEWLMVEVVNLTSQTRNNILRNVEVQAEWYAILTTWRTLAYCCGIIDSCSDKNIMLVHCCDPYCWKIAMETWRKRGWNAVIPRQIVFKSLDSTYSFPGRIIFKSLLNNSKKWV